MNPLKERRTVTTKAITTLFISSVLLVGFMGMSLSLSQTASATAQGGPPEGSPSEDRPTPQCDGGEFESGECIILTCPEGFDPVRDEAGNIISCEDIITAEPEQFCPTGTGQLDEELEVCHEAPDCPTTHPFNTVRDRCERLESAVSGPACRGTDELRDTLGPGNADNVCFLGTRVLCTPGELIEERDRCESEPDLRCPEGFDPVRDEEDNIIGCEDVIEETPEETTTRPGQGVGRGNN